MGALNRETLRRLKKDHAEFRALLDEIEGIIQNPGPDSSKQVRICLHRLLPGLMAHEKVEDSLFGDLPRESKSGGPSVFDILKTSHAQLHEKLESLNEALQVREAKLSQIVAGMDFITLFREHMEEEEEVFFPIIGPRE